MASYNHTPDVQTAATEGFDSCIPGLQQQKCSSHSCNGTIPSLLIRLCLQGAPTVSFWLYQNTHGDNLIEVKHCESNAVHTWRHNWNTASSSNGSAQLEMKNTRFSGGSRLQTQAHRCLAPGGTKSTYGLFMWPREKLDITVMGGGNLTNNNVVEYTSLSWSVLTASFSRKKGYWYTRRFVQYI